MKNGYKILWTDNALRELEKTIEFLEENWTEKEIRNALLLTPNRSPGPSGISAKFFKTFINQLVPTLTKIANKALLEGKIDDFLLKGIITLIPKKENSNKDEDLVWGKMNYNSIFF